jgi:hypothetical protein
MTTEPPTELAVGLSVVTVGGASTVKVFPLTVPMGVETLTAPVMAPTGTVAVIWVALFTVKAAAVPWKVTAEALVKLVPMMTTELPTIPLVGLRLVIVGTGNVTVKVWPLEVPPGVVTVTLPVVAPVGTTALIWVALTGVMDTALVPLKETAVTLARLVPVIVTEPPTDPLVGLRLVMVGAGTVTVKLGPLAVPPGVVTLTTPDTAPTGTVAVICVALFTVKDVASTPPKVTVLAPDRFVPVMVTGIPTNPLVGLRTLTVGAGAVGGVTV